MKNCIEQKLTTFVWAMKNCFAGHGLPTLAVNSLETLFYVN